MGVEKVDVPARRLVLRDDVGAKVEWAELDVPAGGGRIRVRRRGGACDADVPDGWTVERVNTL
jgi:hypothetical protein